MVTIAEKLIMSRFMNTVPTLGNDLVYKDFWVKVVTLNPLAVL